MPVPLHIAAQSLAGQHIQRHKQRGGALALVIMRHGRPAPLFQRQARLGAVKRL